MNVSDQLGRKVAFPRKAERIISLVPSQTEFLVEIGLASKLVGITKFCVHPPHLKKSTELIGGTKQPNIKKIIQLNPDIIIANKEENRREDIEELSKTHPVWVSDVRDLDSAYEMMSLLGSLFDSDCTSLITKLKHQFNELKLKRKALGTAVYLIWNNPFMAAGTDTFINEMLDVAGFVNMIESERYPVISDSEIHELRPEWILLSSEPFPFKKVHLDRIQKEFPNSKVMLVDGELFSWYGSRLALFPQYLQQKFY